MDAPKPSISRITVLVGLLAATVIFALLLALDAHDAVNAERKTAEHALRDYATMASWELRSAARKRLDDVLSRALGPVVTVTEASPFEVLSPLDALRRTADSVLATCDEPSEAGRQYFRLDLRDGSIAGQPAPPLDARLVAAARRFVRDEAKPEASLGIVADVNAAHPGFLALGVRYAKWGAPLAVYGFTVCPSALGAPFFGSVLHQHSLLPAGAAGGLSNDSLFAVMIVDPRGDSTWLASPAVGAQGSSTISLDPWTGWRARVAIRREAEAQLLVRGPLRSRVPLFLGLLAMTAGVAIVAVWQIRREHELAQLRADFTSSVSHELRTPLAQILLFGETLNLGRARSETDARFAAETIVHEARRLMHMVDNILTFSRRRASGIDVAPRAVPLGPAIDGIVAGFRPLAVAAGVRLEVSSSGNPIALADPAALKQILLNLLDNAVKYGPTGQRVRVEACADNDRVRIAVEDEGAGIAAIDRERVWNPYVRLCRDGPARGASAARGSGIGLTVVRELVTSLGGSVWVEDAARGGARFVVDLPAAVVTRAASGVGPFMTASASAAGPPQHRTSVASFGGTDAERV